MTGLHLLHADLLVLQQASIATVVDAAIIGGKRGDPRIFSVPFLIR
jgi:hypothetical protein